MTAKRLKKLPIGIDDFKTLRTEDYYYADKSLCIGEVIKAGRGIVTLIPRPRRFGKTLNMTMLRYFFERFDPSIHQPTAGTPSLRAGRRSPGEDELAASAGGQGDRNYVANRNLFDGLAITKSPTYMKHQGRYPVIFLTFKDIKEKNWAGCYDKLKRRISAEFERHAYLLQKGTLTEQQQEDFKKIISRSASRAAYEDSIKDLSFYLAKYYGANPVILIDEYDSPIHAAFVENYYDNIIPLMRGLMCAGLKGNVNLAYGVITGILRVSKESIFSGMNNLKVCSLLNNRYADKFGLTESEVKTLLAAYKLSKEFDAVRTWYNGYRVGLPKKKNTFTMIYNPWSMLNFADEKGVFAPYWVNTSDNKLVQKLVQQASEDVKSDFERIFTGKTVTKKICEDVFFPSIYNDSNALWSFLVFTGYLTWQARERMQVECDAALMAPNREVLDCLKKLVSQWFTQSIGSSAYQSMLEAVRCGDVPAFKRYFQQSVLDHMSFFDITGQTPERVYHAYVLGLLVGLDASHEVKSNRESGLGRYDVCIIPRDTCNPATIIEFKAFNPEEKKDMQAVAKQALEQIEQKQYDTELRSRGIKNIIKLAIVFDKKDVLIVEGSMKK